MVLQIISFNVISELLIAKHRRHTFHLFGLINSDYAIRRKRDANSSRTVIVTWLCRFVRDAFIFHKEAVSYFDVDHLVYRAEQQISALNHVMVLFEALSSACPVRLLIELFGLQARFCVTCNAR